MKISLLLILSFLAIYANAQKYSSITKFLNEVTDNYRLEDKHVRIISNDGKAPVIEIITKVLGDHSSDNIVMFNQKEIILLAIQAFNYSAIDEFTITATPERITFTTPGNIKTRKIKLLPEYKTTVTISRANALAVVKKQLGVADFKNLFEVMYDIKGVPNEKLKDAMYNKLFYNELIK